MAGLCVTATSRRLSASAQLADDVRRLRYVTTARAAALERLGIRTIRDLLLHVPHRYLDFSHTTDIAHADVGSEVTIVGTVDKVALKRPRPRMQVVELYVLDATGVIRASFFRQPWLAETVHVGDTIALSGKVTFGYGYKQLQGPFHEVLASGEHAAPYARILPVHPVGEGISAAWMRRIVSAAIADAADVVDPLPAELVSRRHLMGLARALRAIHYPTSDEERARARSRLAFDEVLCLQLALLARQRLSLEGTIAHVHVTSGPHQAALEQALPFSLSDEQRRAVEDILHDMAAPSVMNRLLLGDVGTGKTAVAACALASVADTGTQAAVMAPTSVLARQYAEKLGPLLDAAGIGWALLTGATPTAERAAAHERIAAGELTVAFGTTALLSDELSFARLSLVVIDEQHRFGVDQRLALRRKGAGADLLAMTATPIPRSLALTLYGDLSCSRIVHRPVEGAGVRTASIAPENLDVAWTAIADAAREGRQAYVICPVVDEDDDASELDDVPETLQAPSRQLHAATTTAALLRERILPDVSVGLLHGRMSAAEKDEAMARFRSGQTQVLVATTVVEVGVDVPNATCMLVLDADRFGLATLHQLRGRVGRGSLPGMVYLACAARRGTPARSRIDALEATSDGFELAELDLRLRHEGELLGYRQHGGAVLHLVDLAHDARLIEAAHAEAEELITADPMLQDGLHRALALEVRERFGVYFEEVGRT